MSKRQGREMRKKDTYTFGLRKKLVIFVILLAIITYSTSAFFIHYIYPVFARGVNEVTFTIVTLVLGILWSGILAYLAAGFLVKPLQRLESAALEVADGNIQRDVQPPKSDGEIRSLAVTFNIMLKSLREMVHSIEEDFSSTNKRVFSISDQVEKHLKGRRIFPEQ